MKVIRLFTLFPLFLPYLAFSAVLPGEVEKEKPLDSDMVIYTEEAGCVHSEEIPRESGRTGHALYFSKHKNLRTCCDSDKYKKVKEGIRQRLGDPNELEQFLREFRHHKKITPFAEACALLATYSCLYKRSEMTVRAQRLLWANAGSLEAHLATGYNFFSTKERKETQFQKHGQEVIVGKGELSYNIQDAVQNACFAAWHAMTLGWRFQTTYQMDKDAVISWDNWLQDHCLKPYCGDIIPQKAFPNHNGLRNVVLCLQENISTPWERYGGVFKKKALPHANKGKSTKK